MVNLSGQSRTQVRVRKDLIYEGITTMPALVLFQGLAYRQKGPDLRRDYDCKRTFIFIFSSCQKGPDLRRDYDGDYRLIILSIHRQKGPDLRRDYDKLFLGVFVTSKSCQKGPDLRRDYDSERLIYSKNMIVSQKGPDLRRDYDLGDPRYHLLSVELERT